MATTPAKMVDVDHCYEVVMELVENAGIMLATTLTKKAYMEAVLEIHTALINGLHDAFPGHIFVAEEIKSTKIHLGHGPTWVLDPLDGAVNFAHGFPHSCISIAFIVNKISEIGIIYNPLLNQKFTARRGKGAYLNDKRIMTSGQTDIHRSLITTEYGSPRNVERMLIVNENLVRLHKMVESVRSLGSAALNLVMVGVGAADANYEMGAHIWDIAAAELIVREAGGFIIDPSGGEFNIMSRRILGAASLPLAQNIAKNLSQYYPTRDDEN